MFLFTLFYFHVAHRKGERERESAHTNSRLLFLFRIRFLGANERKNPVSYRSLSATGKTYLLWLLHFYSCFIRDVHVVCLQCVHAQHPECIIYFQKFIAWIERGA